jgi:3-hydroxybutyrate dehydrogenase
MTMSLKGKTALITGSTSGIGLGIAEALAEAGADIMVNGIADPATVAEVCGKLRAHGVRAEFSGADISKGDQVRALVQTTHATLGRLDILINNAGIQHVARIEDFPDDRWDAVIAINLSGAFHATKAAIPLMRAGGWGRIINIASAHGLVASEQKSAYVAAKHGILGLTKVTALELADAGITANAICPGWVLTPLVQKQLAARAERDGETVESVTHAFLTEKQAMSQFTTPAQIGAMALFLCSDAASTITGVPISIDGGWTAK